MGTVSVLESLRAALLRPTENSLRTPLELRAPAGAPPLVLRTMTVRDEREWDDVRMRNADWLEPWESNDPMRHRLVTFPQWIAMQRRDERNGDAIVFVMVLDGAKLEDPARTARAGRGAAARAAHDDRARRAGVGRRGHAQR